MSEYEARRQLEVLGDELRAFADRVGAVAAILPRPLDGDETAALAILPLIWSPAVICRNCRTTLEAVSGPMVALRHSDSQASVLCDPCAELFRPDLAAMLPRLRQPRAVR
jgi:hypothetical protein